MAWSSSTSPGGIPTCSSLTGPGSAAGSGAVGDGSFFTHEAEALGDGSLFTLEAEALGDGSLFTLEAEAVGDGSLFTLEAEAEAGSSFGAVAGSDAAFGGLGAGRVGLEGGLALARMAAVAIGPMSRPRWG